MFKTLILPFTFVFFFSIFGANNASQAGEFDKIPNFPTFSAPEAAERAVSFSGVYRTTFTELRQIQEMNEEARANYQKWTIEPVFQYLFGPLTHHSLADPQKGLKVEVKWDQAKMHGDTVDLPYEYQGVWLIRSDVAARGSLSIPFPVNEEVLNTPNWKRCTDSDPEHQTHSFYWYFWEPNRYGCDHKEGVQYYPVTVTFGAETPNTTRTFPEYEKLLNSAGKPNNFQLTFAFGYLKDPSRPNPDRDQDAGIEEYRSFLAAIRQTYSRTLRESPIYQTEYLSGRNARLVIGHRFSGSLNGVDITLNVVAAAGVDQMEIFAKSFAHDHDGFFGWLGHSRVGSGFDAERFGQMVRSNPSYYSITTNYQLVYWGGCNSYAYYTLPFFEHKARAAGGSDPHGTKGLDIIANGLPSYFSLNATNADLVLNSLLNWQSRTSYQEILRGLESRMHEMGGVVMAVVLGDEDNPQ